jgi:Trypsin-like peptidase domain
MSPRKRKTPDQSLAKKMKPISVILALSVVTALATAAPAPPSEVVFKPTFLSGDDSLTAGTGFVARLKGEYVFLTAHHLFGPAGGLERDLSPAEAKEFAVALAGLSMDRSSLVLTSSAMLLIPSAKAFDRSDAGHDVAAFHLGSYRGPSLAVSNVAPKIGEKVYLLACPRGEAKLRLIGAVVTRGGKDALDYFYEESGMNLAGTSGAPILNESGEVVGINLGGRNVNGKTSGFANPAGSFAGLVSSAITANGPSKPTAPSGRGSP